MRKERMSLMLGSPTPPLHLFSRPVKVCYSPLNFFSTSSPISTTTAATIKRPNFGDLPRELRDIIYELHNLAVIKQQQKHSKRGLVTAAPIVVSHKQFGHEVALVSTWRYRCKQTVR